MALLDPDELKLAVQLTGTDEDANLATVIKRADRMIAHRTGRPPATPGAPPTMEARTYVLDLTGDGTRDLDLEVYPVCSVASAKVDDTGDFDGDEDTVASADMSVRGGRKLRLLASSASRWSKVPRANRVTFVAGYGGSSTVTGDHAADAVTITVGSTAQFAVDSSGGGRVVVGDEVITFTGKTSTTLTGCTRGAEGTTAAAITGGATVSQPVPDDLKQAAMMLAKHLWTLLSTQGKQSAPAGQTTITLRDETIPAAVLEILGAYTLPRAVV